MGIKLKLASLPFSAKILLSLIGPALFFGYILEMQPRSMAFLLLFSFELLLLALSPCLRNAGKFRIVILSALLFSVLFYTMSQSTEHGLALVDGKIFFRGAQAVRQNQSPYSSPITSGLNLGFVPVYALCGAMGNSLHEFRKNLLLIDLISSAASAMIIAGGLLWFLKKSEMGLRQNIEVLLEVTLLASLFYLFFRWNRSLGNFCTLLALLVILIMVSHHFNKPVLTGLVLGIAISVKPYFLSVAGGYVIYLILKRDKNSLIVILSAACLLGATALALESYEGGLGLDTYTEFFREVSRKNIPGMLANVDNISAWAALMVLLKNLGIPSNSHLVTGFALLLTLLAYGGGLTLCIREKTKHMLMDDVVYYLLLTTAIYPLVWERYFSWLVGPAIYILCKLNSDPESERLVPAFLLCCVVLMFSSIAWVGTLALPALFLAHTIRTQERTA